MKYVWRRINEEPVAAMAVVQSVVYGVTEFGVDLTGPQQTAILGIVTAVLWFLTRQRVTPTAKPTPLPVPTPDVRNEPPHVR